MDRDPDVSLLDSDEGVLVWAVQDGLTLQGVAEAGCAKVEPQLLTWEQIDDLRSGLPGGAVTDDRACCKRHVPGPVFTQFAGEPAPEFICPECGGRWVWDDDEAEGGAWYWDPENDRNDNEILS